MIPARAVVDTNVVVVSDGRSPEVPEACAADCAAALGTIVTRGHLFVDDAGAIVDEYRRNVSLDGEPGVGRAFLKWVFTNEWNPSRVTRVPITPIDDGTRGFAELPAPPRGVRYDPADRKFLAVAAAHPEHPPIVQATDSKWWAWREALAAAGVKIHFVCPRTTAPADEDATT